ncbi:beta-lactamase domain protein [Leptothrix cholodnii SP-6]|uniref:Beta-lactamase domain protein n=1 Tax=Leptothrix cholodnii (strain ATCC 51168 / LMG 8142 / SP-6) TaxID=395495 RepID=B1Y6Y7_LEPCP|nr:3',5'-cyclic-nucleotide phosphodiesterase [Leptothrix cholodnii]ACB32465.1 beta-lactamase domain protein [Leptothrix cholodnii SP-6]
MNLRVLGCSGSIALDCRTTSFLLNDRVLIDAGTGVGDLALDELAQIDHILISHSHLDHVLGIPLLADSVMQRRLAREDYKPIQVHALPATIDALRRHIFNNVIWPDFTRLPTPERPIIELVTLEVGQRLSLCNLPIEVLPASHTVPACGFGVATTSGWWIYTGDTGPNPALWQTLRGRRIAQLVIETAFSDDERALAEISRHLSPSMLAAELAQLDADTSVAITHVKPGEMAAVTGQIAALGIGLTITALTRGDRFRF